MAARFSVTPSDKRHLEIGEMEATHKGNCLWTDAASETSKMLTKDKSHHRLSSSTETTCFLRVDPS